MLTTGGTGPAPRDVTPEATLAVAHKVLPGFGEQMRQVSLKYVPTAILSRQVGVIRGRALILNLPGQPKAIKETLDGIFPAVPYCIDLIGGPYIETHEDVCKVFRPKSAAAAAIGVTRAMAAEDTQPAAAVRGTQPLSERPRAARRGRARRRGVVARPARANGARRSAAPSCRRSRRAPIVSGPSFERTIASAIASTRSSFDPAWHELMAR